MFSCELDIFKKHCLSKDRKKKCYINGPQNISLIILVILTHDKVFMIILSGYRTRLHAIKYTRITSITNY